MVSSTREFPISQTMLHRNRNSTIIFVVSIILFILGYAVYSSLDDTYFAAFVIFFFFGLSVLIAIASAIVYFATKRDFETTKIAVTENGFVRSSQGFSATIAWKDIQRIRIWKDLKSTVCAIDIFADGRIPQTLAGYEKLEELSEIIIRNVADSALIEEKRQYIDRTDTRTSIITITITFTCLIILINYVGLFNLRIISGFIFLFIGIFTLWYRPLTRRYPQLRQLETFSGALLIVSGLWKFIQLLL